MIIKTLIPKNSNNGIKICECAPTSIIEIFCDNSGIRSAFGFSLLSILCIIIGIKIRSVSPSIQIALSVKKSSLLFIVRYCFTNLNPFCSSPPYSSFKELKLLAITVFPFFFKYIMSSKLHSETICDECEVIKICNCLFFSFNNLFLCALI